MSASSPSISIRKALPEESETLTQIAHEAKRHWGYPERWIQFWDQYLTITPQLIADADVFLAEQDGTVLGFYALVMRDGNAELDHLWVSPHHLGRGIGKELFIHSMRRAAAEAISEVEIVSDPNAEGFYKKMGAEPAGQEVSSVDGTSRVVPRLNIDPRKLQ